MDLDGEGGGGMGGGGEDGNASGCGGLLVRMGQGGGGVESRGVFFCCLDLFERAGGGGWHKSKSAARLIGA